MAMRVVVGNKKKFYRALKYALIFIPLIYVVFWVCNTIYSIVTFERPDNSKFKMPATVLVYNKTFAKRFGLDESKAIELDPGVEAMSLTFKKESEYLFKDVFFNARKLGDFNGVDNLVQHFNLGPVLSILFKSDPDLPYNVGSVKVYLNVYFDNTNLQVKQLMFPQERVWNTSIGEDTLEDKLNGIASAPIYSSMITPDTHRDVPVYYVNTLGDYVNSHYSSFAYTIIMAESTKDFKHDPNGEPFGTHSGTELINTFIADIVPGITFVSFEVDEFEFKDTYLQVTDKNGTWLWIQRFDAPHDKDPQSAKVNYTVANFNRFRVPLEITNSLSVKAVMRFNLGQTIIP